MIKGKVKRILKSSLAQCYNTVYRVVQQKLEHVADKCFADINVNCYDHQKEVILVEVV